MALLSNVVRIDVVEALLRPDLSKVADRKTLWYANVPRGAGDGVAAEGRWTISGVESLAPENAPDAIVRALLEVYGKERQHFRVAAPEDPNFTAPLEIAWRRLPAEEAAKKPYAGTHGFVLTASGSFEKTPATFDAEAIEIAASSPVVQVLNEFGQKRANEEQVVRALIEHDGWLAPAALFAGDVQPAVVPEVVLYGDAAKMPAGVVWIFTERARADRCAAMAAERHGAELGPYVSGVRGVDLFRRLPKVAFERLNVNPGSPLPDTFFLGGDARQLLGLWAEAIALERLLAKSTTYEEPELLRALHDFPGLLTFAKPTGEPLVLSQDGDTSIPIFTALDCAEAFAAAMPGAMKSAYRRVTVLGAKLFEALSKMGVDRISVNAAGPGHRCAMPSSICARVAAGR